MASARASWNASAIGKSAASMSCSASQSLTRPIAAAGPRPHAAAERRRRRRRKKHSHQRLASRERLHTPTGPRVRRALWRALRPPPPHQHARPRATKKTLSKSFLWKIRRNSGRKKSRRLWGATGVRRGGGRVCPAPRPPGAPAMPIRRRRPGDDGEPLARASDYVRCGALRLVRPYAFDFNCNVKVRPPTQPAHRAVPLALTIRWPSWRLSPPSGAPALGQVGAPLAPRAHAASRADAPAGAPRRRAGRARRCWTSSRTSSRTAAARTTRRPSRTAG